MTGGVGGTVSTVKVTPALGPDVLPAVSVAVAVTVWLPSASGVGWAQLNAPPAAATAVQTTVASTLTVTVLPASAVPEYVGVVAFVTLPAVGAVTVGAGGAPVSTVNATGGALA